VTGRRGARTARESSEWLLAALPAVVVVAGTVVGSRAWESGAAWAQGRSQEAATSADAPPKRDTERRGGLAAPAPRAPPAPDLRAVADRDPAR
jgi:hypothetical protein